MRGPRCMPHTFIRCGNVVHTFEKSDSWQNIYILVDALSASTMSSKQCFLVCLEPSDTGKMLVLPLWWFHGFHETNHLDSVYQRDLYFSCEAYFLDPLHNWWVSVCVICMHSVCVLCIYIYIYIYGQEPIWLMGKSEEQFSKLSQKKSKRILSIDMQSDDFCLYLLLGMYEIQGNQHKWTNNIRKNLLNCYV